MVKIDIIIIGNSVQGKRNLKSEYRIYYNTIHKQQQLLKPIGAGKTCLAKRYISERNSDDVFLNTNYQIIEINGKENDQQEFSMRQDPTIGVDHFKKTIRVNDQNIQINIWDTAGQDKYFSITKSFFQKADGVILTFDLTDNQSFKMVQDYWIQQVNDYSGQQVKKILVGNKVDKQEDRKINSLQGADLALKYNMNYFETSALTGESVVQSIETLAKKCAFSIQEHRMSPTIDIVDPKIKVKDFDCLGSMKQMSSKILNMIVPNRKDKNKTPSHQQEKQPQPQDDATKQQQQQQQQQQLTSLTKQVSEEGKSFSQTQQ